MATADIDTGVLRGRIEQLKSNIGDLIEANSNYNDDLYILSWLRGYKFEVAQTEKKIRYAQDWRDKFNRTERNIIDLEAEEQYALFRCTAKDGRMVFVINTKKVDFVEMFKKVSAERQERYLFKTFLELEQGMIEANRRNFDGNLTVHSVNGILGIVELGSVPFRAMMNPRILAFYMAFLRKLLLYFPCAIQAFYWINAPSALRPVLQTISKLFSGPFCKLQVVSGPKEVEEKIHCTISAEQLENAM